MLFCFREERSRNISVKHIDVNLYLELISNENLIPYRNKTFNIYKSFPYLIKKNVINFHNR